MIEYEIHIPVYPKVLIINKNHFFNSKTKIFTYNMLYLYMLVNRHQDQQMVRISERKEKLYNYEINIFLINKLL